MARFGRIYPTYLFKTHDPILDAVDTLISDQNASFDDVAARSGVTVGTLKNWRRRKTRRPQFATIAAVVGALGGHVTITRKLSDSQRRAKQKV